MRANQHLTGALAAFLLGSLSCGDDHAEEENPNAEACEHIAAADKAVALTAAATASPSAPEIRADHKRYDVTTVSVAGGKGGYLTFAAAEAGDYIFFTGTPVQLTVKNPAGADVAAESSSASIPECTQVKGRHVYPLQVGTHVIGITTTADEVRFVVEGSHEH
jgi:hypothetical protein